MVQHASARFSACKPAGNLPLIRIGDIDAGSVVLLRISNPKIRSVGIDQMTQRGSRLVISAHSWRDMQLLETIGAKHASNPVNFKDGNREEVPRSPSCMSIGIMPISSKLSAKIYQGMGNLAII